MRASFSGAAFCQASLVETQQAFLELHVEAFEWFGGVFAQIRFDNLTLGGQAGAEGPPAGRERPLRRAALALPVRVAVHDAGHRGRAREGRRRGRGRALPPQPSRPGPGGRATWPSSTRCCSPAARPTCAGGSSGAPVTVGEAWAAERPLLRALPAEPFDATETATPRVDAKSLVTVRQNRYSVPVAPGRAAGQRADRRARDHDQPRRPRWSRATSGCTAGSAPARSSITTSSCSQRKPGGLRALAGARPGARARRLARRASTSCGRR